MGSGHGHDHGPAGPASARVRWVLAAVLAPFAMAVIVGMVLLWPTHQPHAATGVGFDQATADGTVTATKIVPCSSVSTSGQSASGGGTDTRCNQVTVHLTSGPGAGGFTQQVVGIDPATPTYSVGDGVVLTYQPGVPADQAYTLTDFQRGPPMALLAGIFAVLVVLIGRWRGLAALGALAVSFGLLVFFVLPALLVGSNALFVAVVGSSAIMLAVLYLSHGLSARTSIAVLGTLVSLALIAALGTLFTTLAKLTGLGNEATAVVAPQYPQLDVRGLLIAGFIIGSLGVLDDVTVTQTSAVWELKHTNPRMGPRDLYRAGMRIGRDHIASTVNTLVMAYAGASLPLLLLFSVSGRGTSQVVTADLVAEDVVRALVGAIGLVASVPLTTWLAAFVAGQQRVPAGAEADGRAEQIPAARIGGPAQTPGARQPSPQGPRPPAAGRQRPGGPTPVRPPDVPYPTAKPPGPAYPGPAPARPIPGPVYPNPAAYQEPARTDSADDDARRGRHRHRG